MTCLSSAESIRLFNPPRMTTNVSLLQASPLLNQIAYRIANPAFYGNFDVVEQCTNLSRTALSSTT